MRVLVACEFSGVVRDAFLKLGHDAWSCDLRPCRRAMDRHIVGDCRPLLNDPTWDLVIAHPPCTYLCNSGARWMYKDPNRYVDMLHGVKFFVECLNAKAPMVCVENPVPNGYVLDRIGRKYTQVIQPWQFGHPEAKRTCLWLRGLAPLTPTCVLQKTGPWRNQTINGNDRRGSNKAMERSITYSGVAAAMARQWGG